uniref:Uncharacterized protein n=1 Tax=Arundo donax TaxID=35708 RepID=A0A0A9A1L7_ARUDO
MHQTQEFDSSVCCCYSIMLYSVILHYCIFLFRSCMLTIMLHHLSFLSCLRRVSFIYCLLYYIATDQASLREWYG